MDDTLGRLKANSDICVKAYDEWSGDRKSETKREALQEAIHELRKVASRMEIDVAVSERENQSQKNIPVPTHRSTRPKGAGDNVSILEDQGDHDGGHHSGGKGVKVEKQKTRRRTQRKSSDNS